MDFKTNKYIIVKNVISKKFANFLFEYFLIKKNAVYFMYKNKIIEENSIFGTWNDTQVPNTYSNYADFSTEVLLLKLLPLIEKKTKLKLIPNYSYVRVYKKKDILKKHKDRDSCEISTTLNLGGDPWPIFVEQDSKKKIKVNLKQGDMLIYRGCELEHWRDEFKGNICTQVFLHYNNINNGFKNLYDNRPMLGLPYFIKNNKTI